MNIEILYRPSYSVARVELGKNETIQTESGAMVAMSPDMEMETEAKGGFLKSISRSMFGGESFFMNTYTGEKDGDQILLAPPLPGDQPLDVGYQLGAPQDTMQMLPPGPGVG